MEATGPYLQVMIVLIQLISLKMDDKTTVDCNEAPVSVKALMSRHTDHHLLKDGRLMKDEL